MTKRIYVPLPQPNARIKLICNLLKNEKHELIDADLPVLCESTIGFSGNDLSNLCVDAAMGPLRDDGIDIEYMPLESIRPLSMKDFENSLKKIKPSVSEEECLYYEEWNRKFGSSSL